MPADSTAMADPSPPPKKKWQKGRAVILLTLLALAAVGGAAYWWSSRFYVQTDNAYVACHVARIAPRVSGKVTEILAADNVLVQTGQPLVKLDPTDYAVAVRQAQAALDRLRDDVAARYAAVAEAQARIKRAEANLGKAHTDQERYRNLFERRTVPKEMLDRVNTAFKVATAELAAAQAEHRRALAVIGGSLEASPEEQPEIKEARARADQARLDLEYTVIAAPLAGYVTRKAVQVGDWVNRGQTLMMLVPQGERDLWVEANFKETQLTHVRLGQPVDCKVDTYPEETFKGRVDSIMSGTGSAFALLPAENATGNWVKVVQRIPVKITLTPPLPANRPLRVGMSVVATIDTHDRSGAVLLEGRR